MGILTELPQTPALPRVIELCFRQSPLSATPLRARMPVRSPKLVHGRGSLPATELQDRGLLSKEPRLWHQPAQIGT